MKKLINTIAFIKISAFLIIILLCGCSSADYRSSITYEQERTEIINMIKNGELISNDGQTIELPEKYAYLSEGGEIFISLSESNELSVLFFDAISTKFGFLDDYIAYQYTECDEFVQIIPYDLCESVKENWYYLSM